MYCISTLKILGGPFRKEKAARYDSKYFMSTPLRPSSLMLGTVQFGLSYGVANQAGAPAFSEICAMLEEAAAAGINCLDTAAAYGESEEVLGRALSEISLRDSFYIVSKTLPVPAGLSPAEGRAQLRGSVERSLQRLKVDWLPLVLLHRDDDPSHLEALASCQEAGLIKNYGVSMVSPERAASFLADPGLGGIQVPANVLDRRFTESGITRSAHQRGAFVFARSCYLQGLLLMDDASTPPHLKPVIPARDFFKKFAADSGMPLTHLLARAMMSREDIDSVVMGMETRAQLRENLGLLNQPPLPPSILSQLSAFQPDLPPWLIDPPKWAARSL